MDLSKFVESALIGIAEGVAKSQEYEKHGDRIGPTFHFEMGHKTDIRGVFAHGSNNYTVVEFDVAVTTETSGEAKGGFKIVALGSADAQVKHGNATVSKLRFSVPILLPQNAGA